MTTTTTIAPRTIGRPPSELTDRQRVKLIELAERRASLEAEARQARATLIREARKALASGASLRAIGEALGVSKWTVRTMLQEEAA